MFSLILITSLSACGKKAPDADLSSAADAAAPISSLAQGDAGAVPPVDPNAQPGGDTLFGKMAVEGRTRPQTQPTADAVFVSLAGAGAEIKQFQQTLGSTYKARYCRGGYTTDGAFAINVCEYDNPGAAIAGRELGNKMLASVPNREAWAHKAVTLTILQLNPDDVTTAKKKKLVSAFNSL